VRATDDSRDTNVILDVITTMRVGPSTSVRSGEARQGRLMINPFIYAEEACGFDRIEDLEEARPSQYFTREPTRFSVEPVTRNASIMSIQERLVGGLRKTAAQRYLDFRRLYPGLDARIPQYHVAGYLGVSPEFLSKLRKRLIRDEYRLAPS
jgi:hypothetical protein